MFTCFICHLNYLTPQSLKDHFVFGNHNISIISTYRCMQSNCCRSWSSLHKFISHLERSHAAPVVNNVNGYDVNNVDEVDDVHEGVGHENVIIGDDIHENNMDNNVDVNEPLIEINEPVSLESFVKAVCKNAEIISAEFSAIPNMNRKNVTTIIGIMSDFLNCGIVSSLKEKTLRCFDDCESNDPLFRNKLYEIKCMFDMLSNPFEFVLTEHKRLQSLKKEGFYISPEPQLYGHCDDYDRIGGNLELVRDSSYGLFVPLRKVLKSFLELPGMFDLIMNYVNSLNHETVCKNFVQGELWRKISLNFQDQIVLPIHVHFDDFEPDNVLGSHVTSNSLGAVYATIPALPPQIRSSLANMFLLTLFLTKDRKRFGNRMIFSPVVDEFKFLEETGVEISLSTGNLRVFFCLGLIVADNKGNNSILGLVESFTAHYFCNICKMHLHDTHHSCVSDDRLRRNPQNYDEDVALGDPKLTGVKEKCVFNDIPSYHLTQNISCDILHDIFEGMLNYGLCAILKELIVERDYFSIEVLHERISGFDYGPTEAGNKPPAFQVTTDRIKNDNLNLSGSEMLCLARYLGEMISDLVPTTCEAWRYYLVLREILEIVTCSYHTEGTDIYLKSLIEAHHELYIRVSKSHLKAKHHKMTHLPEALRNNGPLIDFSALASERKHRLSKMYAHSSNSRVHLPLSVSVKLQLQLAKHLIELSCNPQQPDFKALSSVKSVQASTLHLYPYFSDVVTFGENDFVNVVKSVDVLGTTYQKEMVVVTGYKDLFPIFAKIEHIVILQNTVYFVLRLKTTLSYRVESCAYVVNDTMNFLFLTQGEFFSYVPLWQRFAVSDGKPLVSLRTAL